MSVSIPFIFPSLGPIKASDFNANFNALASSITSGVCPVSPITSITLQAAIDSCPSGGIVDVGNAGTVTLTSAITITKPCTIRIGSTHFVCNLDTYMFLVQSSGVSFVGVGTDISRLENQSNVGNVIQWDTAVYTDLNVSNIRFDQPSPLHTTATIISGNTFMTVANIGSLTVGTQLYIRQVVTNVLVKSISGNTVYVKTSVGSDYTFNVSTTTYVDYGTAQRTQLGAIVSKCANINAALPIIPKQRLNIFNCHFHGGNQCISLERTYYTSISNCWFGDYCNQALNIWNCDFYTFTNNILYDPNNYAVNAIEAGQTGALLKKNEYGKIADNIIYGTMYEAIQVRGPYTICSGNRIYNATGMGIQVSNVGGTSPINDVIISNNIVSCINGGSGGQCIDIGGDATGLLYDVVVDGNTFILSGSNATAPAITIYGTKQSDIIVSNNTVRGNGVTGTNIRGIQIGGSAIGSSVKIINNTISGFPDRGIFSMGCYNAEIRGNTIHDCSGYGIYISGIANNNPSINIVDGNTIYNCGSQSIFVDSGSYLKLLKLTPNNTAFDISGNPSIIRNDSVSYAGNLSYTYSGNPPRAGRIDKSDVFYNGNVIAGGSPGWICITSGWFTKGRGTWTTGTTYYVSNVVVNANKIYQATTAGVAGITAPIHTSGAVTDGTVTWQYIGSGTTSENWYTGLVCSIGEMVINGSNVYQVVASAGTTGATAPTHTSGAVSDGNVTWAFVIAGSPCGIKSLPAISL